MAFRVLVDRSQIEVFVNEREQLVELILPAPDSRGFRLFAERGEVGVVRLTTFQLASS